MTYERGHWVVFPEKDKDWIQVLVFNRKQQRVEAKYFVHPQGRRQRPQERFSLISVGIFGFIVASCFAWLGLWWSFGLWAGILTYFGGYLLTTHNVLSSVEKAVDRAVRKVDQLAEQEAKKKELMVRARTHLDRHTEEAALRLHAAQEAEQLLTKRR